jgi:hypothetical protein
MAEDDIQWKTVQMVFCAEMKVDFEAAPTDWVSGFASQTKGLKPLNGLRHPATPGTTGWYLWCGEESSEAKDFYQPTHTEHLYQDYPMVAKFLGLPAGYRFLVTEDHFDVWFDPALLNT